MSIQGSFSRVTSRTRLSSVNVLLVDADERMVSLLRKVLISLGFGGIYIAKNGNEALQQLASKPIDLVITDWEMNPMNGVEFIHYIRNNRLSPNRQMPIIMLTGKAKRQQVEEARDKGVTEFLVKPFTVRTLCDRIILVIEHPRNFILTTYYCGPDRRRKQIPLLSRANRRKEAANDSFVLAKHDNVTVFRKAEEEITVIQADSSLHEKIGIHVSMDDVFNPENIARAQRIIHQSRGEYLEWVVSDLKQLDAAFRKLEVNTRHDRQDIDVVQTIALHIKSQAGVFDYALASQVADSLYDVCLSRQHFSASACLAGRKHVDALYVIFQRNIQGSGGIIGEELQKSLFALVEIIRD
ncbi:MAG: response regulator [Rickettsiales bacterium]|nr:response regulator [Rickettsiales bacterium]